MTKRFLLPAEFAESFPGIVLFIFLQLFSQNISLTQLPKHIFQIPIVQHFPKFLLFPFLQCPGIIFSQKSNLSVKFIFLHLKKRSILFAGIRKKNNIDSRSILGIESGLDATRENLQRLSPLFLAGIIAHDRIFHKNLRPPILGHQTIGIINCLARRRCNVRKRHEYRNLRLAGKQKKT